MENDTKRKRLLEELDEAIADGLGEFNIKIKEDGAFFIEYYRWEKNPSQLNCQTALENLPTFGGLESSDGDIIILKHLRKIRI